MNSLPLLQTASEQSIEDGTEVLYQPSSIARKLYISHFLSTWNMRLFEFGAVLFLASIAPGTLLPLSIYALIRALAAVSLSAIVGRYIDRTDRLISIRVSIVGQRSAVAVSCLLFWAMMLSKPANGFSSLLAALALTALSALACVEKLCAIANTVAVERDWVVVIGGEDEALLQTMNARMRRIDLFCKLVGPLFIALIDGLSPKFAVLITLILNLISIPAEYGLIARVYYSIPALHNTTAADTIDDEPTTQPNRPSKIRWPCSNTSVGSNLKAYILAPAFLPSLSLSLLYLTVLSFSGQTTTYLLSHPNITPTKIGLIRTVATIFELSSTFLAPLLIQRIGAPRAGIWCLSWQISCLATGIGLTFLYVPNTLPRPPTILIATIALSRVGLYAFDLTAQLQIQNTTPSAERNRFSTTEAALQNFFELVAFALTVVFPRPDQFVYPACVSFGAVCAAGAVYAKYVRDRRGHLLHLPCADCKKLEREERDDETENGENNAQMGHRYEMVAPAVEDERDTEQLNEHQWQRQQQ